jgi:hypothetical protein
MRVRMQDRTGVACRRVRTQDMTGQVQEESRDACVHVRAMCANSSQASLLTLPSACAGQFACSCAWPHGLRRICQGTQQHWPCHSPRALPARTSSRLVPAASCEMPKYMFFR